jgi:surfactin synthase thioesterase subunit
MPRKPTWITSAAGRRSPRLRLFCFPYAGGGAQLFRPWHEYFAASGIEICAVRLPGREERFDEPPEVDIRVLAERVRGGIADFFGVPFALFGHSMGALLAYELACRLRDVGGPSPVRLVVSACRPPHVPDPQPHIYALPDEQVVAELARYGGTPAEVLAEPDLLALILPLVRADAQLTEAYVHVERAPLAVPITALHADRDHLVTRDEVAGWAPYTTDRFDLQSIVGDHFVLQSDRDQVMAMVSRAFLAL